MSKKIVSLEKVCNFVVVSFSQCKINTLVNTMQTFCQNNAIL